MSSPYSTPSASPKLTITTDLLRLMTCLAVHSLGFCVNVAGRRGRKSDTISFIRGFINHRISTDLTNNFKLPKKRMER
jgi:hypothetical protein